MAVMIDPSAPVSITPRPLKPEGTGRLSMRRCSISSRVKLSWMSTTAPATPISPSTRPKPDWLRLISDHQMRYVNRAILGEDLCNQEAGRRPIGKSRCRGFDVCCKELRLWITFNQKCPLASMFGDHRGPMSVKSGLQPFEYGIGLDAPHCTGCHPYLNVQFCHELDP